MTKEEFDTTKWKPGMYVTIKGEPGGPYEVMEVDFGDNVVGFFTDDDDYLRLSYKDVEVVKE